MHRTQISRLTGLAAIAAIVLASVASANSITIDMGTVVSGTFPTGDQSSKPYLVATITDGTNNGHSGVFLTMSAPGLGFAGSGNYEHVNQGAGPAWLFDLKSTSGLTQSSFTLITTSTLPLADHGSNGFKLPTISIGGSHQVMGDTSDNFNLGFAFSEGANDGQGGGAEFGHGDSIEYFISGLSTGSFEPATKTPGGGLGTYFSEARIDDGNVSVAGVVTSTPTPLPTSAWAGLALFTGLGAWRVIRNRAST